MSWWGKKKKTDGASSTDQALVFQDPRTRVNTTSAATETTKTAVQNSTIIDNNKNTVIYTTTSRTVTHTQKARVTEMITRRTPSQAELDELFAQLHMNGGSGMGGVASGNGFGGSSSGIRRTRLEGVALRSTPSFKHSSEPKRSSTVFKTEQTTSSQKQGRTVTQHVETQRLVLNPKPTWPPTSSSTSSSSTSSPASASTTIVPYTSLKPLDRGYVSPYAKSSLIGASSTVTPTNKIVLSSPKITSTPKFTLSTKPTPSTTPKTTTSKPFISLNPSTGAVPKRYTSSISSMDAKGEFKPKLPEPKITKKLKPAEVVIFNHEKFESNEFRVGSAADVKILKEVFQELKCNVQVIKNATVAEVKNAVRKRK